MTTWNLELNDIQDRAIAPAVVRGEWDCFTVIAQEYYPKLDTTIGILKNMGTAVNRDGAIEWLKHQPVELFT